MYGALRKRSWRRAMRSFLCMYKRGVLLWDTRDISVRPRHPIPLGEAIWLYRILLCCHLLEEFQHSDLVFIRIGEDSELIVMAFCQFDHAFDVLILILSFG